MDKRCVSVRLLLQNYSMPPHRTGHTFTSTSSQQKSTKLPKAYKLTKLLNFRIVTSDSGRSALFVNKGQLLFLASVEEDKMVIKHITVIWEINEQGQIRRENMVK